MKTVLLTGATGTMGAAGLKELLKQDNFKIKLLVRPSKKNKKKLQYLHNNPSVEIIWGDLTNYDDVLKSVTGSDYVLHVGGMVSPNADFHPEETYKVNVGAAKNIVNAILAQPNADDIKLVYIGSVSQTGFYNWPNVYGQIGDRIKAADFDQYAASKVEAERIVAESGIKHWVSLRQTSILYPEIIKNGYTPTIFHVPLQGCLEWVTVEDSGRLLTNVCQDSVPDSFWNNFYNVSSGKDFRMTNYEFECRLLKALRCPKPEAIFNANWFALQNFHGQWYNDSDVLEDILHFRSNVSKDDYFESIGRRVPFIFSLSKVFPHIVKLAMKHLAHHKMLGTMTWIKNNDKEHIKAYFGSYNDWEEIPSWKQLDRTKYVWASGKAYKTEDLQHDNTQKFNTLKPDDEYELSDMQAIAEERGGRCLSQEMTKGDMVTKLKWQCESGHIFEASPKLIVKGGHWCKECLNR